MGKRILLGVFGLLVVLVIGAGVAYLATQPMPPPDTSESARWLLPGPHAIARSELVFVDPSRSTAANGDYAGAASRTLETSLWYPTNEDGMHPLVIYSHGFVSNRNGGSYIAENLASHGYVVVAADYPLTHGGAPGGPVISDVVHQPGDVTFLIDSVIDLNGADRPLPGRIDTARIGVAGLSLGGLTSTLVAFHPRLRDPRITAAVSIAGPANMFTKAFFNTATLPFLMIAGTVDALVDYESNAATIPERAASGGLITIEGGSHTSFAAIAEPLLRFMAHPDALGCTAVIGSVESDDQNVFGFLGDERDGIVFDDDAPAMCSLDPLPEALHPGRQQMITQIAVLSFLESVFSTDTKRRGAATRELMDGLPADFSEVTYRVR